MRSKKISDEEIAQRLSEVDGWSLNGQEISKLFGFPDFVKAIRFVDTIAVEAERINHHPDIDIRYNKVKLTLTTHDVGGLTINDFELARLANIHAD